jgi:transcriptional regulator with XRE-family HTH domain
MDEENFWTRVKRLLKERKATQSEAAAVCGVKVRTFQSWIRYNYFPTILDGYNLACFLGVSVEYLVTGKESEINGKIKITRAFLKKADETLRDIKG